MRVVLKVTSGSYAGRSILLQRGQSLKVGRTEWSDFAVPIDDRMSGVHFSITAEEQGCRVRDLESTNGTFVNDARITEAVLEDGDRLVAGRTSFEVSVERSESIAHQVVSTSAPSATPAVRVPVADTTRSTDVSAADSGARTILLAFAAVSDAERPYTSGLQDPDADVRGAALYAAAWTRQKWLLDYCRNLARQPALEDWDALYLLAILGQPSDLERILTIGRSKALGARRFAAYAAFGHPRVLPDLLIEIANNDPNTAVAAGGAFTKITGADIDSDQRVTLQPEEEAPQDELAQDFLEEAFLPSPQLATAHWNDQKDTLTRGLRWRRGVEISQPLANNVLDSLDMEARWQTRMRIHFAGQACLSPVDAALRLPV